MAQKLLKVQKRKVAPAKAVASQPKKIVLDLLAGIGGFHLAMHKLGGKCVFACEWDNLFKVTKCDLESHANFLNASYVRCA